MRLRPIEPDDLQVVVAMNDAAYPAVNVISADEMSTLIAKGFTFAAIGDVGELLGFLIGFEPGVDYASENYKFFSARGDNFLYVDRIVVAESSRGEGIGEAMYQAVFALAKTQGRSEVDCEVNLDPPNPGSLIFHGRLGFERVGQQETKGGLFTVALLAKKL